MTCKDCIYRAMCYKIEHYGYGLETEEPCEMFKNKADYAEVKHGEWITTEDDGGWKCSECGGEIIADAYGDVHPLDDCGWIGCPYCLAKMDGNNLSTIPTGSEGSSDNEQSI